MTTSSARAAVVPTTAERVPFLPRGVRLDEAGFASRHRVISLVLALHLPALAALGVLRDEGGWLLWGQLAVMALLLALGRGLTGQVVRASVTGLGLMIGADVLLHVGGGLTDLHIWFYVLLALIALYQSWAPFLIAVGFVAVHHAVVSLAIPDEVFSTAEGQAHPVLFAGLHAVFVGAAAQLRRR
ncbi:hypothetical protein [Modestobacter sp. SYSU DS0511]